MDFSSRYKNSCNNFREGLGDGCHVLNYNYSILSQMSYDEASEYVKSQEVPEEISCLKSNTLYHEYYYNQGNSIVSEVTNAGKNSLLKKFY